MVLPNPKSGLVIRYGFLWSDAAQAGLVDAAKDRPCAIILTVKTAAGQDRVSLVPITHAAPRAGQVHLALSASECRGIGLDDAPHWVAVAEINRFIWPGFDLRQIAGTGRFDYGVLPKATMRKILAAVLELQDRRAARVTIRD